jgi:hypothetical protein
MLLPARMTAALVLSVIAALFVAEVAMQEETMTLLLVFVCLAIFP